ncbi:MAG: hypothetical protein HGA24_08505, partial [Candidatus Aminicenantes bacterium]|nr:hypothetical protein [Candidatus Aminicenantes bacterium]
MRRAVFSVVLAVLCVAAASAQAVKEVEPNDKLEQAQSVRLGDRIEGLIEVARDYDYFKFVLGASGQTMVQVEVSAVPGVFIYLYVYDEKGKKVWETNGREALSPSGFGLALGPGTYYAAVWGDKANVNDTYVLDIKDLGPWKEGREAEPNDRFEQAQEIRIGQSIEGFFQTSSDLDHYKLVVDKPGRNLVQIDLSGVASVRSQLRILGADQKELWDTANPSAGEPAAIPYFCVSEGVYYLVVRAYQKNIAVPYAMSVRLLGPWQEGQEAEPNDKKEWANPIKLDTPILGRVNSPQDADWYKLEVPVPGLDIMVVEETGIPGGIHWGRLEIIDAKGTSRIYDFPGQEKGREEIVRMRVEPGEYLLGLKVLRSVEPGAEYHLRVGKAAKPPASAEEVQQALAKALDWLAVHQRKDGTWDSPGSYHEAYAGLSLMAFIGGKCVPKDYSANVRAALSYLRSKFVPGNKFPAGSPESAKNGGAFVASNVHRMYQQAIAATAVIEALVDMNDTGLEPMAQEAVDLILRAQNTEHKPETLGGPIKPEKTSYGGWRYKPDNTDSDLSVSGWQILALKAAENAGFTVPPHVFPAAATFVRSLQGKKDGSVLYQTPGPRGDSGGRAGMGALSLQLCGYPDDPAVLPALRFMQDYAPRWNVEDPGEGRPFYYWYYATRAMYLAGGDDWRVWKDWMCRFLVDHQS